MALAERYCDQEQKEYTRGLRPWEEKMCFRWGLMSGLLLLSSAASATAPHHWRIYTGDPDLNAQVCYPADLLHVSRDKRDWHNIMLLGPDGGEVLVDGRSEKYTTLGAELSDSIDYYTNPYPIVKHRGDDAVMDYSFTVKIVQSIAKPDWYFFKGENKRIVVYVWRYYVDHAFKGLEVIYPKSNAAAWKGVPERMRACFKSLGPITNPNLQ